MKIQDITKAKNPDLVNSLPAIMRAAEQARLTALKTDTAIVVLQEGNLVRITAEELRNRTR